MNRIVIKKEVFFMDKILTDIEKQRRAENIYYSRRNNCNNVAEDINVSKINIYKYLFQILFLINITICFFCIQNKTYIFKENFLYDVNLFIDNVKMRMSEEKIVYENIINNEIAENTVAFLEINAPNSEEIVEKSEEEKEIEVLNILYNFRNPLECGIVTSKFGERNLDDEVEYHTGIDLAAESGEYIKSSITGIVTLISSDGNYR